MSRTIRKLYDTTTLPPLEGNSDEEFEPLYTKGTNSKFSGLVLSSHSESEQEEVQESDQELPESGNHIAKAEGKNKKKKKKKKKQPKPKIAATNNNDDNKELDEIDKSLLEVYAILGSPSPASAQVPAEKKVDPMKLLLSVQAKHLDFNNELKRIFGSESLDDSRGKKCRPHNVVKYRRGAIVPIPENRHYVRLGLSMSLHRRENDPRSYFTFDHNREYQKRHQHFLEMMSHEDVLPLDDNRTHIAGLLQSADDMFRAEEYTAANNLLEEIISYLHYVAHPCFNLTDQSIRLEYKYMENRPFHIAVLKYCHMLTNKACHRTALELAKLLLNLDPSDPLAIIYVIDAIALRAREHQWLIDVIDYWKKERDAGYLFNIQYSYAMAHFHVAKKNKSNDYSRADELVQDAMLHYPTVAARLFENCKQDCANVTNHPYFSLSGEDKFPEKIKTAMIFHAKLVCWRWREPEVMQWFLRNANEVVRKLDNDPVVKKRGEELLRQRHSLYAACPEQIHRHLHVVRPMANLLVEWELPQMSRQASWDPLPPADGINRYKYGVTPEDYYTGLFNLFARFVGPGQLYPLERRDQRHALPNEENLQQDREDRPPGEIPVTNNPESNPNRRIIECDTLESNSSGRNFQPSSDSSENPDDYKEDSDEETDSDTEEITRAGRTFCELLTQVARVPGDERFDPDLWDPTSIFCIIATEFCERFSFCGLRTILSLYLRNVLCLHENAATVVYHIFIMLCYTMPLMGAILADNFIGRYKVILYFSIIYLIGTVLTCCSAIPPLMLPPTTTSMIGLALIATGTGGIKPCVAAFGGDQFRLPEENQRLQRFFSTFYCTVNLGGFMGMIVTPALRRSIMCFGDDACYALGFGFPALLVLVSIVIFVAGKPWYRIKQPRDNVTLKFVSCAWYALMKRLRYDRDKDGPPLQHWLDYASEKYGEKLVADMKIVFSILYLYLPVPIFWSLFDQQGSRWIFQAFRLRSEVFGVTLIPDQLQVMNPAMVLLMIPVCPGGVWPILPDLPPLQKMFVGGILAAMAFVSAGILQIGIERSTLQVPAHHQSGLVLLNTLGCPVEVAVRGEGVAPVEQHGTALMAPLPHHVLTVTASCPVNCAGRVMKRHRVREDLKTVASMFMPIVIGQNSDDQISLYFMDPNPFTKSLTGKPKLKVVYVGDTGPNKNVSITVETDRRLSDIYYVSDAPIDHIGESAYMCMQPGKFRWRAESAGGEVSGAGEGYLRAGGVYVLCLRERLGRLDAAVLHAPNPPNELQLAWIVPQYLLVSVAEIMFAVSGLEFSFTQAPKSMKTITIAAWYVSVAFGNLIVILVAQTKIFESRATEFFVYAAVLTLAMLAFLRMAQGYQTRSIEGDASSSESRPLLHHRSKVISVHSLSTSSTRAFSGRSSAASCLGLMERARPANWPTRAYVHLATPSTSEPRVTTLAK
ncbi:hypothetical protein ABMA28_000469 [Loxostege sticticalis]|uniref:Oligopeptide transporter 1 n=1 Tax=Loxostege sticticalis TaxID=481309 RepID=A0ABD0TSH9_LOXSC